MSVKVKICGVANPHDAAEIAMLNVDFIGYIFYPGSCRFVGINPDQAIFEIPAGINKTGVFVDEAISSVIETVKKHHLSFVQLHGNESPRYCKLLREHGIRIIKAFVLAKDADFNSIRDYENECDYFLFDSGIGHKGGSGKKSDWSILDDFQSSKPFFLSGGIGPEDAEAIRNLDLRNLFGIDINSRFEIMPGIKDISAVRNFLVQLNN